METDSPVTSKPKKQIKNEDLFNAAEKGDVSLFESLPEEQSLKALSLHDEDKRSLLHVAVSFGQTQVVKILSATEPLICGVNSADREGWAPLHSAATSGNVEIVDILLSRGADVNLKNNGGRTALHYDASKGWLKIAELLISHGANANVKDKVCSLTEAFFLNAELLDQTTLQQHILESIQKSVFIDCLKIVDSSWLYPIATCSKHRKLGIV